MIAPTTAEANPSSWWLPLVEGMLAIVLGLMFLANPSVTSMSFVLGWGLFWFAVGVVDLICIFQDRRNWGWKLATGILGILAGGLIMSGMLGQNHPLGTVFVVGTTFTFLVSIMGIVYGVGNLLAAFRGGGWWPGVLGAIGILFGAIVLFHPLAATLLLPWSLGIVLIAGGIFLIVIAFRMR